MSYVSFKQCGIVPVYPFSDWLTPWGGQEMQFIPAQHPAAMHWWLDKHHRGEPQPIPGCFSTSIFFTFSLPIAFPIPTLQTWRSAALLSNAAQRGSTCRTHAPQPQHLTWQPFTASFSPCLFGPHICCRWCPVLSSSLCFNDSEQQHSHQLSFKLNPSDCTAVQCTVV